MGWGGVGWGGIITFMFPCTHRHSNLIIFLAVLQTQAVMVGWGGVGWDNNVHVPVHPQAQQPHHLSCCPADTGSDGWGGVGWGGIITFMFPCTHRHSNLIIFLAVLQAHTGSDGGVGWGGVG